MNKSLLFRNGDTMPVLGRGTWKSSPGDVCNDVKEAIGRVDVIGTSGGGLVAVNPPLE